MLSVLVCHSYFLRFDEKQCQRAKPYPPLATLQVASLLREAGHAIQLFDAMLAESTDEFDLALAAARPDIVLFYEDNYNFLSKMCLGRMRAACCDMVGRARAADVRVLVAGSDASDEPAAYLAAGANLVLLGEALGALMAIVSRLDNDLSATPKNLAAGLPDVVWANRPGVPAVRAGGPLPASGLGHQPAWDLVDLARYRRIWLDAHGYFSLNMAASRGCSFRCNWCAKPIWGNRYLQREPAHVASEMLRLKKVYAVDHIWFADDIFGFKPDWVSEFGNALAIGGGGMPFTIQIRADLVSDRMAAALALAGCREAWIGAESGSQKILDAMGKGTRVDLLIRAREQLGARGIRVGFFLMLGYLGEELEDILATRALVSRAMPDDVGVSVAYPLPGTSFYESVRRQLGDKRNWDQSSDLEMMFAGTFRSEFYRAVRDLLHEQVDDGASPGLEARWQDLLARQAHYRQAPESAAAWARQARRTH